MPSKRDSVAARKSKCLFSCFTPREKILEVRFILRLVGWAGRPGKRGARDVFFFVVSVMCFSGLGLSVYDVCVF